MPRRKTCRECRVEYEMNWATGFPMLDPVQVCERHAMVDELAEALRDTIILLNETASFGPTVATTQLLAEYDRLKGESR